MKRALVLIVATIVACKQAADPQALVNRLREGTAEERTAAVTELVALGNEAGPVVTEIEKAVLDDDVEVRKAAVTVLAAIGSDAQSGLVVALGDADASIREQAAAALGAQGYAAEKAIPNLIERLSDPDFRVSASAGRALVQIGDAARPALARLVTTSDEDTRDRALRALVELGEGSIPDLVRAIKSRDADVRAAAIESLIVLKAPADAALDSYREALRDKDTRVRDAAARAVQSLGESGAPAAPDLLPLLADRDNAGPAAWALRDIGLAAVPVLVGALQHTAPEVRRGAAQCLGTLGDTSDAVVDGLVTALGDAEVAVRREAVAALGALGPPARAMQALKARTSDADPTVAKRASEALARAK